MADINRNTRTADNGNIVETFLFYGRNSETDIFEAMYVTPQPGRWGGWIVYDLMHHGDGYDGMTQWTPSSQP